MLRLKQILSDCKCFNIRGWAAAWRADWNRSSEQIAGGRMESRLASAPAGYETAGYGTAGHGTAGYETAGYGTAGHGTAGYGTAGYETAPPGPGGAVSCE